MIDSHSSPEVASLSDSPRTSALPNRMEFEELLSNISAKLIAAGPGHLAEIIQSALDDVRQFFRADRCGLLAVSEDLKVMHVAHASYSEQATHISSDIDLMQLFPWFRQKVVIEREVVQMTRTADLPAEAVVDRATFASFGTKSLLIIPIEVGQKNRVHLVLISSVTEERIWPDEFLPRMRLLGEMLVNTIERAKAFERLDRVREKLHSENDYLRKEAKQRLGPQEIVGRGQAIRRTLALAQQVAGTASTVLLLGETGSGKGRLASYIHERSHRRDHAMITVNCSAIPPSLMESELFGREKGAYTGALSKQIGRFELAHGSTLFIDEIGELPLDMQVKLLRALESRSIERLGNPKPISVDLRIIAATNRDLEAAVRDGRFREDLYYRLNVFPITVPPLRDRRDDIPLFVQAFIDEFAGSMAKPVEGVDPSDMQALCEYAWPGNVRELRNVIERAMIMANGSILRIPLPEVRIKTPDISGLADMERAQILKVLQDTLWRIRGPHGAAARLGLKPTTLESRIKVLGLVRPGTK